MDRFQLHVQNYSSISSETPQRVLLFYSQIKENLFRLKVKTMLAETKGGDKGEGKGKAA